MTKGTRLLNDLTKLINALASDGRIGKSVAQMYLRRIVELQQGLEQNEGEK